MHPHVSFWLTRSTWTLLLACVSFTPVAAQRDPGNDALTGYRKNIWRSSVFPNRIMRSVPMRDGAAVLLLAGSFEALVFAKEDGTSFIGISRSPEGRSVQQGSPRRYQVLHVIRVDSTTLSTSFSESLVKPGDRSELWVLDRPPNSLKLEPPTIAVSDTSLPKFGDYVYAEELPEAVHRVRPEYPESAQMRGLQGTVMVQALVERDGSVKEARVVKSVPGLDDYAIAAVKQWRFRPAMSKGRPVAVWVGVPVKFPPP